MSDSNVRPYCSAFGSHELLKIDQAKNNDEPLTSVGPILCSLMKLDSLSHDCLIDLCFTIAKEKIPFAQLENKYGIDLGTSYSNDVSLHCIALKYKKLL